MHNNTFFITHISLRKQCHHLRDFPNPGQKGFSSPPTRRTNAGSPSWFEKRCRTDTCAAMVPPFRWAFQNSPEASASGPIELRDLAVNEQCKKDNGRFFIDHCPF